MILKVEGRNPSPPLEEKVPTIEVDPGKATLTIVDPRKSLQGPMVDAQIEHRRIFVGAFSKSSITSEMVGARAISLGNGHPDFPQRSKG
jgi:hypothetical protein